MPHLTKETNHFCILYSLSHIWVTVLFLALLPRAEGHLPSQTILPQPVWVMIRKKHTPKKETHTYPLACQCPLWKCVLRQHHHSLVGCLPCSRKEGDIRGQSRPKHSYTTWHLTDKGTKGQS